MTVPRFASLRFGIFFFETICRNEGRGPVTKIIHVTEDFELQVRGVKLDQNKFFRKSESERYILVCLRKSE